MFTGIVTDIGEVKAIQPRGEGLHRIKIACSYPSASIIEGASIAPTLRARAQSLRVQLLAEEEAAANTASEKLTAPVALLSIAFLLLFLYPALARLVAS